MDIAVVITISAIIGVAVMLWVAADRAERMWYRRHPPDDGMSEVDLDDDDIA